MMKLYFHPTIGDEITQNLHESEDPAIIEHVVSRFEAFYEKI